MAMIASTFIVIMLQTQTVSNHWKTRSMLVPITGTSPEPKQSMTSLCAMWMTNFDRPRFVQDEPQLLQLDSKV